MVGAANITIGLKKYSKKMPFITIWHDFGVFFACVAIYFDLIYKRQNIRLHLGKKVAVFCGF